MRLDRPHPPSLSPRALTIVGWSAFLLAGALFLAVAWSITARSSVGALDVAVADWLHDHGRPALTLFLLAVTHLNSTVAVSAWSAILIIALARLRERYWILTLLLTVGGGMLVNLLLKAAYERVRPHFDDPLLVLDTYSFPSGHTSAAVLFYGMLAAFLVSRTHERRLRFAAVGGAIAMVALVAFSRVYLGAHYVSDVVAAICSSAVWLSLCLSAGHALVRKKLRPRWIAAGVLALIAATAAVALPLDNWSSAVELMIERANPAAALLIFCAVTVVGTLLFVPAWIFPVVGGAAFGFAWGLAATLVATALSTAAAFLLSRYAVPRRIDHALRSSRSFRSVEAVVASHPWKMVALLRMSPLVPSGMKSYCLGLTRVRFVDYLGASIAGMLPGIVLKVYVGAAGRDVLAEGSPLKWTLLAAGIAATLACGWLLTSRSSAALSRARQA